MNIASNGIRIHVEDEGEGALAIVFLHSWGGSTREWDHIISALPSGYRTVTMDQRGWGASDQPSTGYSLAELGDDTQGVIEALGLERYILVGHSMGGKTAQFVASRRPNGLVGLVLIAPAPPSPLNAPEALISQMGGPDVRGFVTMAVDQLLTHTPLSHEDFELLVADAERGSVPARVAWGRQTSQEDITEAVSHIQAPTIVISGEHDKIDPIDTLKRELLPSIPGAVLQTLPDVGHLSPFEAPKEIAKRIDAFAKHTRSGR